MNRRQQTWGKLPSVTSFFLIVATALLFVLIFRVVYTDTDIPVSSTEAEATAVANERLFQLAQWTVGSILTIGIALIGFNWAQTQRDRAEIDGAIARIDEVAADLNKRQAEFQSDIESRIKQLEIAVLFSWDANLGERLLQEARRETHPLEPTPSYFIRKFRIPKISYAYKRAYSQLVLQRADVEANRNALIAQEIELLQAFLPELLNFDPSLGNWLAQFLHERANTGDKS